MPTMQLRRAEQAQSRVVAMIPECNALLHVFFKFRKGSSQTLARIQNDKLGQGTSPSSGPESTRVTASQGEYTTNRT